MHGATIDLVRDAFNSQGVEVTFDAVDGVMAQEIQLTVGRADAAADFTITDRRLRWFAFSDRYHIEELQALTLKHGLIWPGWQHFGGIVGVKADSYALEYLIRHHHQVRHLPVDSTERLFAVLGEGRVQAIVLSRITGAAFLESGDHDDVVVSGTPFGPAPLALAALPEQRSVLDIFNAGLAIVGSEVERLSPFRPH